MSAPRRVLTILHAFPSFEVGGTQRGIVRLINHFGRRFRHVIVSLDGDMSCASRLDITLDCQVLANVMRKSRALSLANMAQARRTARNFRADLLITYGWGAMEWVLSNRWLPLCRHLHFEDGFAYDPNETPRNQKLRRILFRRFSLGSNTLIVVPSETLYRIAIETWGFHRSRVFYVANGIDVEKFAGGADLSAIPELRRRRDELVIGTLGGLRQVKRIDRLMKAFAALPSDIHAFLVVAGDGPERSSLGAMAVELGISSRVLFTGNIEAPERVVGLFDIFALTSDTEQMPYALIEAMAAGLPIVATDVGDVKGMVARENTPLIVPITAPDALTAALCKLARDPIHRQLLGNRNQEKARREFAEATMIKTYEVLFAEGSMKIKQHNVQDPGAGGIRNAVC